MSTLGGASVLECVLYMPFSGGWRATVSLDSTTLPPLGATVLTMGDLNLPGRVIRTDFDDALNSSGGARASAVVRGGAGWRLPVIRAGNYSASSVRLSTVIQDVASMAGESYVLPSDQPLGEAYTWQASTPIAPVRCEDILSDLVARGYLTTWRVDPTSGATRFDAWPSIGAADTRGRILSRALAHGRRTVGLDVAVSPFLPGATLEGVAIHHTVFREESGQLRADVYAQTSAGGTVSGVVDLGEAAAVQAQILAGSSVIGGIVG